MRALVVSRNRLAGLGLVTLAEGVGLSARAASLDEAAAAGRGGDIILLYCDAWEEDARRAAGRLQAGHARFITVAGRMDAAARRDMLAAGAVYACLQEEAEELALVLGNYGRSARPSAGQISLPNGFVVDLARRRVQQGARFRELTLTECQILSILHAEAESRPGQPVALPEITVHVWGSVGARSTATLRGHVSQLRSKVEVDPEHPWVLCGRRGYGYWLVLAERPSA